MHDPRCPVPDLASPSCSPPPPTDQVRNSYQLCNNGTLRVMYANGMGISFHTEPHILAGSVSPTIGRRNITLPTDNGLNSIEWRLRKEQTKGRITVFGRKLRVSRRPARRVEPRPRQLQRLRTPVA